MNLTLVRDDSGPDHQFGKLTTDGLALETMERPSVMVPAGTYQLVMHDTVIHPRTWALVNPDLGIYHEPGDVPNGITGRVACLIHPGNVATQSDGCVLVGLGRSMLDGMPDVSFSQSAFASLKSVVPWTNDHTLTVS